ncbi:lipoprotein LipL41 [Leptospira semungkisensis]|uniref:Lipoprotein LipL41 n=1 Tax=Leptospira semungkisensis TaxID=2484985 RepID=A0A4V3JCN1_9LEPT|nr:lipoprotein LipL41 [Leptospira semungkisensis]TGK06779.1 lipoprotein LipL41 [Leptospira semungkisensis]
MRRNLLYVFIAGFIYTSCQSVRVEYPYFAQTKEGRELRIFLKGVRNVGLAVEPPKSDVWAEDYDVSRSFLAVVPDKIFEAFSNDSYFKLIDLSKRADVLNEQTFTLTGITQNRIQVGNLLGAEAILYISVARPASECTIEMRADYWAMGVQVLQVAAAANQSRRHRSYGGGGYGGQQAQPVMRPTGVRRILLPIEASLVRVDTGETKKAVITKPVVVDSGAGDTNCSAMLESLSKALDETIPEIEARLSPRVKTESVSIFTKDEDPEIESFLTDGYEEIKGETPSFQRAKAAWEKADQKAKGKSWAAKANLATYYFSQGDFEKASELYDQAAKLGGPEESYLIDLRKLTASAAEAIE